MIDINKSNRFEYTKKDYIKYLNEVGESLSDDEFIIGGIMRKRRDNYGQLLYKHDPVAFNVGYYDWKLEKQGHL